MTETNYAFGKAVPILASLDIAQTLKFYKESLGFKTQHIGLAQPSS